MTTKESAPPAPAKTPAEVKRASTANTRRRLAKIQAEPELTSVTLLAAELGLAPSTIKKLAGRMGCDKLGRAFYFTKAQADSVRRNPPLGRKRVKGPAGGV